MSSARSDLPPTPPVKSKVLRVGWWCFGIGFILGWCVLGYLFLFVAFICAIAALFKKQSKRGFILLAATIAASSLWGFFAVSYYNRIIQQTEEQLHLNAPQETEPAPTDKSAIALTPRAAAAIDHWNKTFRVPASKEFRAAMQRCADSTSTFMQVSSTVPADAVYQTTTKEPGLSRSLQAYKQASLEMLSAIHSYHEVLHAELQRIRIPVDQQEQIAQTQSEDYRIFDEWGSAAVQAAEAGRTLRSLIDRGLPSETAQEHFIDTWNAACAIQQRLLEHAQKHQTNIDELLRK